VGIPYHASRGKIGLKENLKEILEAIQMGKTKDTAVK